MWEGLNGFEQDLVAGTEMILFEPLSDLTCNGPLKVINNLAIAKLPLPP
jgi:hypothetical protein